MEAKQPLDVRNGFAEVLILRRGSSCGLGFRRRVPGNHGYVERQEPKAPTHIPREDQVLPKYTVAHIAVEHFGRRGSPLGELCPAERAMPQPHRQRLERHATDPGRVTYI